MQEEHKVTENEQPTDMNWPRREVIDAVTTEPEVNDTVV
jgi:hypothetical protein